MKAHISYCDGITDQRPINLDLTYISQSRDHSLWRPLKMQILT